MVAPEFRNGEPQPYPRVAGGDPSRYLRDTEVLQVFVTVHIGDDRLYGYCVSNA